MAIVTDGNNDSSSILPTIKDSRPRPFQHLTLAWPSLATMTLGCSAIIVPSLLSTTHNDITHRHHLWLLTITHLTCIHGRRASVQDKVSLPMLACPGLVQLSMRKQHRPCLVRSSNQILMHRLILLEPVPHHPGQWGCDRARTCVPVMWHSQGMARAETSTRKVRTQV